MAIHEMAQDFFTVSSRWRSAPEHQSQHRRKTVFDGIRRGLVGGLFNEFPVHHQCPPWRCAPFAWPDTKSSRKFTKPEWPYPTPQSVREEILAILLILSKKTLRSPCVSFACPNLVSIRGVFVSSKAWPRSGAAKARHCAGACPLAQGRACRTVAQPPLPKLAFVFRRGAPNPYEKPRFKILIS